MHYSEKGLHTQPGDIHKLLPPGFASSPPGSIRDPLCLWPQSPSAFIRDHLNPYRCFLEIYLESTRGFVRVPLSPDGCLFHPAQWMLWSLLISSSFPGQRTFLNAVLIPSECSTVSLKPFSALVRYFRDFPRLSEPSQSLS